MKNILPIRKLKSLKEDIARLLRTGGQPRTKSLRTESALNITKFLMKPAWLKSAMTKPVAAQL